VCVLAPTTSLPVAFVIMAAVGTCGGFFVVPLNALLQEQGHKTVGAGHAVAVQNLAENSAMLLMIGFYTLTVRAGAPVTGIAGGFGAALSLAIGILWLRRRRLTRAVLNAS
jgi:LPLT family lysophospholipid transporter-like MFS transporter